VIWHDDERVQEEFPLAAVVEDSSLKQLRCGRDLEKPAAFGRDSGYEIRPSLLRCKPHFGSIDERPVAKATSFASSKSGA
jgi:hypothetical protein